MSAPTASHTTCRARRTLLRRTTADGEDVLSTPQPPSIARLIREDALDAELAALLWILVEARVPLVVCGAAPEQRRRAVMEALLDLAAMRTDESDPVPEPAVMGPSDAWSPALSARVLALRPGDPFAMVVKADSLRDLMARLTAAPDGLSSDEVRALGLVIVVGGDGRVDAAHLLRPVERDAQDHLQRRPPAVLASRDPSSGALDHFAWGISPELGDRVDLSERDLDRRVAGRREVLARLAAEGGDAVDEQRRLAEHLVSEPPREPAPQRPRARDAWPSRNDDHVH